MQHPAAYTTILVNHDQQHSRLQVYESYLTKGRAPTLNIRRGDTEVRGSHCLVESA